MVAVTLDGHHDGRVLVVLASWLDLDCWCGSGFWVDTKLVLIIVQYCMIFSPVNIVVSVEIPTKKREDRIKSISDIIVY